MDISKYMIYMNNINAFNEDQKKQLVIDSFNEASMLTNYFKAKVPVDLDSTKTLYDFNEIFRQYSKDSGYSEYYDTEHKDEDPDDDVPDGYQECGDVTEEEKLENEGTCYIYSNTLLEVLDVFTFEKIHKHKYSTYEYFKPVTKNVFSFDGNKCHYNEGHNLSCKKEEILDEDGNGTGKYKYYVKGYFVCSYIPHFSYVEPKDEIQLMSLIEMILRKKTLLLVPNQFTPNMIQVLDNEIKKQVYMVSKHNSFINEIDYRDTNNYLKV